MVIFGSAASAQLAGQATPGPQRPKYSVQEIHQALLASPLAHVQMTAKMVNPKVQQALHPAILQDLQLQKNGATLAAAHTMGATGQATTGGLLSTPPAGGSGPPPGGVNPAVRPATSGFAGPAATNATAGSSPPPHAGGSGTPGAPAGMVPGSSGVAAIAHPMLRVTASQATATAAAPPPSTSPSSSFKLMTEAPALLQNICPPGPGPVVMNVNGKPHGAIFTPDPTGNDYSIVGCHFGSSIGDAHLEGGFKTGPIPLLIDSWSDTNIRAHVNPALSGEPDASNVSLVIVPVGNPSLARIPGFSFYAMRATVPLQTLPQKAATLASISDSGGTPVTPGFSSPYIELTTSSNTFGSGPTTSSSFSAGIKRSATNRFSPGTDYWDLSGLAPGFAPVQFQFAHWTFDGCVVGPLPHAETIYNDGTWGASWDPQNSNRIIVNFAELHCHDSQSLMQLSDDYSDSDYALTVDVVGPRGVDPWSK
jgi:hypothetical protein